MFALIRKSDNVIVAFVETTNGYDLAEYTALAVTGDATQLTWDGAQLVQRPPTPSEEVAAAFDSDPRWVALQSATPTQIDNWLTANVTNIAQARAVLRVLLLAIRKLNR